MCTYWAQLETFDTQNSSAQYVQRKITEAKTCLTNSLPLKASNLTPFNLACGHFDPIWLKPCPYKTCNAIITRTLIQWSRSYIYLTLFNLTLTIRHNLNMPVPIPKCHSSESKATVYILYLTNRN